MDRVPRLSVSLPAILALLAAATTVLAEDAGEVAEVALLVGVRRGGVEVVEHGFDLRHLAGVGDDAGGGEGQGSGQAGGQADTRVHDSSSRGDSRDGGV